MQIDPPDAPLMDPLLRKTIDLSLFGFFTFEVLCVTCMCHVRVALHVTCVHKFRGTVCVIFNTQHC